LARIKYTQVIFGVRWGPIVFLFLPPEAHFLCDLP